MSNPTYFELGPDMAGRSSVEKLPSGLLLTFYRGRPGLNAISDARDFRFLLSRGYVQVVKGDDGAFVALDEAKRSQSVTRASLRQAEETAEGNGEGAPGLAGGAPVTSGAPGKPAAPAPKAPAPKEAAKPKPKSKGKR
jgi:hypothetical protein